MTMIVSVTIIEPPLLLIYVNAAPSRNRLLAFFEPALATGFVVLLLHTILTAKIVSYAHVLKNVRRLAKQIDQTTKEAAAASPLLINPNELSPENYEIIRKNSQNLAQLCTLSHLLYFAAAPTLCYQLSFPRIPKIRRWWLFHKIIELIISLSLLS
jgi:diacylglycerol O-acyltransferase-1